MVEFIFVWISCSVLEDSGESSRNPIRHFVRVPKCISFQLWRIYQRLIRSGNRCNGTDVCAPHDFFVVVKVFIYSVVEAPFFIWVVPILLLSWIVLRITIEMKRDMTGDRDETRQ
jgi:hypothetical protein